MATEPQVIPLPGIPGVQRDGTPFETDRWSDGTWCRFNNRGNPRKIGGFRRLTNGLTDVTRAVWAGASDQNTYLHCGQPSGIQALVINTHSGVPTDGVTSLGPSGLNADVLNGNWTFDQTYNPGGTNSVLFAHYSYSALDIASQTPGAIYYANAYSTDSFVSIGTTDPQDSGGIVMLHPFLFSFGNFGTVNWSSAANPLNVGTSNARVTEQKIVAAREVRGGSGAAPAGLFWSLNALLRATYIGGSAQFQFDTISDQTNIYAQKSIVELDGVFYWVSNGRFLRYTGVIQECQNNVNVDDFFDNLNLNYRNRIWGVAVDRWGELWWFWPRGTATECNHATIYSARLSQQFGTPVWYDTPIPLDQFRTAGVGPTTFPYPVWTGMHFPVTGTGYNMYQHELLWDAVYDAPLALIASITTPNITVAVGGTSANVRLTRLEPDIRQQGIMNLTLTAKAYARSQPVFLSASCSPTDTKIDDLRAEGREITITFRNAELNGSFEFGRNLIHVAPGSKRPADLPAALPAPMEAFAAPVYLPPVPFLESVAVTPVGTSQSGAGALQAARNYVSGGAAGTNVAVVLPAYTLLENDEIPVYNRAGFTITVFPPTGGYLEGYGTNTGLMLLDNSVARFSASPSGAIVFA